MTLGSFGEGRGLAEQVELRDSAHPASILRNRGPFYFISLEAPTWKPLSRAPAGGVFSQEGSQWSLVVSLVARSCRRGAGRQGRRARLNRSRGQAGGAHLQTEEHLSPRGDGNSKGLFHH